jgi:AAA15 family ATPase/GTPase
MFSLLEIIDFRALKNKTFHIGECVTMLAGWNATGKSTILALLANSSELKPDEGRTYNGKLFRAEFSEILKGSKIHDVSKHKQRLKLTRSENGSEITKSYRTSWQGGGSRFRLIPREEDPATKKTKTEAKFDIPVIYLGLSRLYPLGETDYRQIHDEKQIFKSDADETWFKDSYRQILSNDESITAVTNIDFTTAKKNTAGVSAANYDWRTNSSGQDNLSQILFAVLSFKNLKRDKGAAFRGGLLLIDELEASLHPKAQEKIADLLVKEAKDTGFQVIFTTHSLTIIETLSDRASKPKSKIASYYFTKRNGILDISRNMPFAEIKADLLVSRIEYPSRKKLLVFVEDAEARWFLRIAEGIFKEGKYSRHQYWLPIIGGFNECRSGILQPFGGF